MISKFHIAAAVGTLLVVLLIFVCPAANLPAAALRAQQASLLLLLSMALCARYPFTRTYVAPVSQSRIHYLAKSVSESGPSSLTGVLLC